MSLLDPDKRAAYDQQLKQQSVARTEDSLGHSNDQLESGFAMPVPVSFKRQAATAVPMSPVEPTIEHKRFWILPISVSAGIVIIFVGVIAVVTVGGSTKDEAKSETTDHDKGRLPSESSTSVSGDGTPDDQVGIRKANPRSQLGKLRNGLRFEGNGFLRSKTSYSGISPITIEVVAVPTQVFGTIVGNSEASGLGLQIRQGYWSFLLYDKVGYKRTTSKQPAEFGKRAVVACVFDGQAMKLFVNGELQATTPVLEHKPSEHCFLAGADPDGADGPEHFFTGIIESVHISAAALYSESYEPVDQFAADESTLLLLQLEEGEGNVANDSSIHTNHCPIMGASWTTIAED